MPALHLGLRNQSSEAGRVHRTPSRVHQDLARRGMPAPKVQPLRAYFAHFRRHIARRALQKILRHGIGMRVLRLPDEVKEDLHSGGNSTILAFRQSRASPQYSRALVEQTW